MLPKPLVKYGSSPAMGRLTKGDLAMKSTMTRKDFIVGAGAAAAVAMGASAMAFADEPAASWQPDSWAAEADIVIVGCGGAGICAAITAADEGLGDALVLEAAPEGLEGGNTRVSAQVIFCPTSVEGAVEYQTNLNGGQTRAWATPWCSRRLPRASRAVTPA